MFLNTCGAMLDVGYEQRIGIIASFVRYRTTEELTGEDGKTATKLVRVLVMLVIVNNNVSVVHADCRTASYGQEFADIILLLNSLIEVKGLQNMF